MLFAIGRSSEEPSTARSDRDAVHCVARHAVRCHDLLRHRAVWAVERSAVAHDTGAGTRDTEPRHLQPGLSYPRSEQLLGGLSALHQGVCDGGQNQGAGALDGKALRRAYERGQSHMPPVMVTAWSAMTHMALVNVLAPGNNEAAGALQLVELLQLKGCVVTADALHCHRWMAKAIVGRGGDYVLAVKNSQPGLLRDAKAAISAAERKKAKQATTNDADHGRKETRTAIVTVVKDMAENHDFPGLKAVAADHQQAWTRQDCPALLPSDPMLHADRTAAHRSRTLGYRKRSALDARRRSRRGSGAEPKRPCPHQPRRSAAAWPQYCSRSSRHKDLVARQLKRAAWDDSFLVDMLLNMR
jgi:predicted transposase YbfD/YdcC